MTVILSKVRQQGKTPFSCSDTPIGRMAIDTPDIRKLVYGGVPWVRAARGMDALFPTTRLVHGYDSIHGLKIIVSVRLAISTIGPEPEEQKREISISVH